MGCLLGYHYGNGILLGSSDDDRVRTKQPNTSQRRTNVVLSPHSHPAPEVSVSLDLHVAAVHYERISCHSFPR